MTSHFRPLLALLSLIALCAAGTTHAIDAGEPGIALEITQADKEAGIVDEAAEIADAAPADTTPTPEISAEMPFPLVCSISNLMAVEPAKVTNYDYRTLLMVEKNGENLYVSPLGRSDYSSDFRTAFLGEYRLLITTPERLLGQQPGQRAGSMLGLSAENGNTVVALSVQTQGGLFSGVGVCETFTLPALP